MSTFYDAVPTGGEKWIGWDDLSREQKDQYEKGWIDSFMLETNCDDRLYAEMEFEWWLNRKAQYGINFAKVDLNRISARKHS